MADSVSGSLELLLLMGGGGLLSMLGFWLMLREGPGGGGTKLGFGSMQVPTSTAGFAIFFGGLAAFSAPIVAPDSVHQAIVQIAPAKLRPGPGDPASFVRARGQMTGDDEPRNDRLEGATFLAIGQLLGGTQSGKDVDWYELELEPVAARRVEVDLAGEARGCRASFFNTDRRYLGLKPLSRGRNHLELGQSGDARMYLKIDCMEAGGITSYTIAHGPAAG
jgi:hypothetical protein